jgi:hypothetical protein
MGHGFAQGGIDPRLATVPRGLEGFKHICIHAHIQGGALHCNGWPSTAAVGRFTATAGLPRPRLMLACCQ